ncbi:MAG: hypothetical protein JWO63_2982, partial [Frankiales bacterium]|nr:hypothetical protein [Frankiales bacterium]
LHRLALLGASTQLFVVETMGARPRAIVWAVLAGSLSWLTEIEQLVASSGCKAVFMPIRPLTLQAWAELDERTLRNATSRLAQQLASVGEGERIGAAHADGLDQARAAIMRRAQSARALLGELDDAVLDCHRLERLVPSSLLAQRAAAVRALERLDEEYCSTNGGVPEIWPF